MNRQKIIIVGILAVLVAILIIVAIQPEKKKVNPYITQLEQEKLSYTAQFDSMQAVIENMDARFNAVRTQLDSAQASNKVILAALQKVTNGMKEYQKLYNEQSALNNKLEKQLEQADEVNLAQEEELKKLRAALAEKDAESIDLANYNNRILTSLEASKNREQEAIETISKVFAYIGTEDELKNDGYLEVKQKTIFHNNYKLIGFPDEMDNRVIKAVVGGGIIVNGEVDFLADRHGKLRKDREYGLEKDGNSVKLTFTESTLEGQRILVVLK